MRRSRSVSRRVARRTAKAQRSRKVSRKRRSSRLRTAKRVAKRVSKVTRRSNRRRVRKLYGGNLDLLEAELIKMYKHSVAAEMTGTYEKEYVDACVEDIKSILSIIKQESTKPDIKTTSSSPQTKLLKQIVDGTFDIDTLGIHLSGPCAYFPDYKLYDFFKRKDVKEMVATTSGNSGVLKYYEDITHPVASRTSQGRNLQGKDEFVREFSNTDLSPLPPKK